MPKHKIDAYHIGEIWPAAQPAADRDLYGSVDFTPVGAFEVRSLQTFRLVYTAGPYGMDDTGALRVLFRFATDWGNLQVDDPAEDNFVSAAASNGATLKLSYDDDTLPRPRYHGLTVLLTNGYLSEGDTITIIFGDTSGGARGLRLPSFCESRFEFKVAVDIYATGYFIPVENSPAISIVPSKPALWKGIAPTLRRVEEKFWLGIKAEDCWGNPTDQAEMTVLLTANMPVAGLPSKVNFPKGCRSVRIDDLSVGQEGVLRISITDQYGTLLANANPVVIKNGPYAAFWGDLHGQSAETVGVGSAREYFQFARDLAFLDVSAHQGNDFQITNAFWQHLNRLTAEFNQDGQFVVFPGYEWSGNTSIGGDHNVYFRHEDRQIHRSSHALLTDQSDIDTDSPNARDLFHDLAGEDCVVYAHCGGRHANIRYAHDPALVTSMEIHSAWGTFEWLVEDCFELGYRCGVVGNSDGHKGRPGASHPGTASFAAYGGLTCFVANELDRNAIFESIRDRHTYATTGNRMHLDVRARFHNPAKRYNRDPRFCSNAPRQVTEVMMGDIVLAEDRYIHLMVEAVSHTPIERIEILNGVEVVKILRGYSEKDVGDRIRVVWRGAENRGRGNRTRWRGKAFFEDCSIKKLVEINNWNPERPFDVSDSNTVSWENLTAGNFCGFDVWLDPIDRGRLHITTNLVSGRYDLKNIGLQDIILDAAGLRRQLRITRLPSRGGFLEIRETTELKISPSGDNPLWVRVTTEDGHHAWSSPIYVYRNDGADR